MAKKVRYEIRLEKNELEYLSDTDFLISKQKVTEKIKDLLKETESDLHHLIAENNFRFPKGVLLKSGKISKGEHYRQLPYLILDYPRYFHPEGVFAFRTMFWWGNFFSCTLHLQGEYLEKFRASLFDHVEFLKENGFYVSVSQSPWEHHYKKDNYQLLNDFGQEALKTLIFFKPFIKLSKKIDLTEYKALPAFATQTFLLLIKSLGITPLRT